MPYSKLRLNYTRGQEYALVKKFLIFNLSPNLCTCLKQRIYFLKHFIGVQFLYNDVLFSAVQQSESVIRIHISPFFQISFPFRSPQSIQSSSLCYTAGSHQLSILYIVVYICQSQSPNSSKQDIFNQWIIMLPIPLKG